MYALTEFDPKAAELMMSTREIAELTDKRHDHVIRDTRVMINTLNSQSPNLGTSAGAGWQQRKYEVGECAPANVGKLKEILLNQELTLCLIAGYNVNLRMAVIKRWLELEEQGKKLEAPKVPQTYSEALLTAGKLAAELEQKQLQLSKVNETITHQETVINEQNENICKQGRIIQQLQHKLTHRVDRVGYILLADARRLLSPSLSKETVEILVGLYNIPTDTCAIPTKGHISLVKIVDAEAYAAATKQFYAEIIKVTSSRYSHPLLGGKRFSA